MNESYISKESAIYNKQYVKKLAAENFYKKKGDYAGEINFAPRCLSGINLKYARAQPGYGELEIKIENDPRTYLIMLEDCERLISDNHSIYEIKLTHLRFNKETEFIDNMISKNYRLWKIDLQIDYSELDDTEEMFSKNKELINVTLRFGKTTIPSLEEMFYKNEDLKTIRIEADTMHIDMSKLNNICYKCQEIQRVIYTTTDASTESNED